MKEYLDPTFWLAIAGAVVVKLASSPYQGLIRTALTIFAAVFSAVVFTDPVLHYLGLDSNVYRHGVAALTALTGEGLMRFAMQAATDPIKIADWWRKGK